MQSNLDDLPVGGGGPKQNLPQEEFANPASQAVDNSGPLEQRLVSKNWLVRATAFEEVANLFKNAQSQFSDEFRDHSSQWKKYLSDVNPGSLEKCLDALEAFINRADPKLVLSAQNEIIKVLIEKCVGHAKASVKTKGLECFNLLFEVTEAFEESIETMTESLQSKNAKISQNALIALNSWLSNYGAKKIKVKSFTSFIENAAASSNPSIRQEAMNFYKECYKTYGDGVKPLMANIKKQQQDDLDKEFTQMKDLPKPQYRITRTEQKKAKEAVIDELIKKEEEENKGDSEAFDLYDSVDILTKYGSNEWQDKILEMKNWKEKKDLLEELLNDSNVPKIKPGDFSGLTKVIKKMLADSNAVVYQTAVKICLNLAKGLRKDFEQSCKELSTPLISKFKEKKTQLIEDISSVLSEFMNCTNLENLTPEIIVGLQDKAPSVKKYVCNFIEKGAQATYIDVLQRASGELLNALMKASEDPQSEVRDAALQALGIFKGRLGESAMSKFLADLNPQKLQKVNESAQNVKPSKYDRPEKQEKKTAPAAPPKKTAAGPAKKAPVKKQESQTNASEDIIMKDSTLSNNFDEQPLKSGGCFSNNFDDMPIGGGPKNMGNIEDEAPIGGRGGYNLDNLDSMDAFGTGLNEMAPPKKKAPARLMQQKKKPEEEEKGSQDTLINDDAVMSPKKEEVKKPPVRQPPEPKAKPSTTTAAKTTTTAKPSGPQIQEEDVGPGLSKEEAEAKVAETFPADIVSKFEEAKWQDKVEAFKGISEQITQLQPGQDVIEALAKFIKSRMKDWKESNVNLVKESINLFKVIAQNCERVNKRTVSCLMPFLSDKLGDVKTLASVQELLIGLSELVTPKYVALQIMKYGSTAKSPNVIKESTNQLIKMTDEFGVINMPLKEMIDFGILAANHTNPQVRTASMALFAIMFQHAGEPIKNFLKDIKESTLKLIEEEFSKVTPYKKGEYQQKRRFRGEAAAAQQEAGPKKGGGGGLQALLDDALPRADISKQLSGKLMPMFKHNDWKVRKEAAEKVEEICKSANMRIQPVGLNELMDNMKQRMSDPNKAVLKAYIQLMGVLVEAIGPAAKQFQKKLLPGMLATLADKQSLVRQDALACMGKWAEHVGPEVIINNVGPMLTQENPELRTEALKWIIKQKDFIKTSEVKDIVKALVSCLSDKTPAIRSMAEEVISYVMPITGYSAFQAVLSDLLPAVQNTIKPILEKVKQKVGVTNSAQDQMSGSTGGQMPKANQNPPQQQTQQQPTVGPGTLQKQNSMKPTLKQKVQPTPNQENQQHQQPQLKLNQSLSSSFQPNQQNMASTLSKKKDGQTPAQLKQAPQRSESKDAVKPKGFSQTITQFKQEEPQQQDQLMVNLGFKEKRAEYDRKNKFQLEDIKGEQIDKLKNFTTQSLGQQVCAKMFSNDFKLHVECIEMYNQLTFTAPDSLKEILDLIFKWALVKLQDSGNTKFAVSIFDFLASLFQHLEESEYQLWDFEAQIVIPLLCEKTGLNNNILKDKVKRLIRMLYTIYDVKKCYLLIVQYGLNSKNLRAQAECLDELAEFISKYGVDYCSEKEMRIVAKMADNADKNIRENALKFMGEAFKILENDIWRAVGDVTPKVQGLLEGRFKKLKVGGGGLAQSASSSNFFKPESNHLALSGGGREQSPKPMQEGFKTQQNFGLKKTIQQSQEIGKQAVTPRSQLQFNRASQVQDQKQTAQHALSRSINQFNASNRSNEETKQTPHGIPKKQDMLKKVVSQDQPQITSQLNKRPIPQTQRPGDTSNDFNQVGRGSEPNQPNLKSSFAGIKQQAYAQVTKNTQMFFEDDDEDLRILTSDDNFRTNPEFDRQLEEITKHIHQLKYADLSKRVDSLVSLNEMISALDLNKDVLIKTSNDLVSAFTHVLNDIFDKNVDDIPLRFAKYFITIVLKTCSCKEIMREVSEEKIFDLAEQLLTRLLIEGLDKVGDNKEGELILKNLNSSMLRLLENCNHTYMFCVLFNLLRKYKDYPLMPKLPNLIIKCLLKLSKILEKLIDKLDMEKILLAIHEYLIVINHDNKTQNDEMGIRIVKTVTNELVKLKRESIWEAYRVIQLHGTPDNHIYRWIQIILKSLQTQGSTPSGGTQSTHSSGEQEIRMIVEELRNPDKFETAIPKLHRFLEQNPQIDLNDYLQDCSKTFQQFIKTNLDKHKQSQREVKPGQEFGMMDSMKSTNNSDNQPQEPEIKMSQVNQNAGTSSRISEYQSKLASIKMRNHQRTGAETTTNRDQAAQGTLIGAGSTSTHNLNTSFSAMNTSLSQKWHEINKKSAATKREGLQSNIQQMSNTMIGFSSNNNNLESRIGMGQNATQVPMNQSIGAGASGEQNVGGGATNQDLNKRLAEMKAKLQALKKK